MKTIRALIGKPIIFLGSVFTAVGIIILHGMEKAAKKVEKLESLR